MNLSPKMYVLSCGQFHSPLGKAKLSMGLIQHLENNKHRDGIKDKFGDFTLDLCIVVISVCFVVDVHGCRLVS